jgi:hypothetical protein
MCNFNFMVNVYVLRYNTLVNISYGEVNSTFCAKYLVVNSIWLISHMERLTFWQVNSIYGDTKSLVVYYVALNMSWIFRICFFSHIMCI